MPSPFPGMDPYLESPTQWKDFHHRFINVLSEAIADRLPGNYFARLGEDVVFIQPEPQQSRPKREPDILVFRDPSKPGGLPPAAAGAARAQVTTFSNVEQSDPHTEAYIEILRLPELSVVTVVELLSPTNKAGDGRAYYLEKRKQLLQQNLHLLEIDLLRAGRRLQLDRPLPSADYYAFLSRADRRPRCDVYWWTVRQPLPLLPIPLLPSDTDVEIDLAGALGTAYHRGRYDRLIHYDQAPPPPSFAGDDSQWVAETAAGHAVS